MRIAVFDGPEAPVRIEQVAIPQPRRDEILVRICRCGVCGSDISMTGDAPFSYQPGPFGHEYAGEVVDVGADVLTLKAGDRVACLPSTPCGRCEGCRKGNFVFCSSPRPPRGAGFGEYTAMPAISAILLPQTLSLADGALVEPMACGLHAVRMGGIRGGERVLVLGAGSMALSAIYWARRLGAGRIVALSRSTHRKDMLMAMGTDAVHGFDTDDPGELPELLGGEPDIVIECVGKAGFLNKAIEHVRPQGTVISVGMCMQHELLVPALATFKELRLLFPIAYSVDEFVETARAFEADQIRPDIIVSDVIALEELPSMLENMRAGTVRSLKVLVDPTLGRSTSTAPAL